MSFPPGESFPPSDDGHANPEALQGSERVTQPVPVVAYGPQEPSGLSSAAELPEEPSQFWRRTRRFAIELVQTLALAAIIFFSVRALAQNFRVEGASMEPGLHNGEYLLVNKAIYQKINLSTLAKYLPFIDPGDNPQRFLFRSPKRGDVVVFHYPKDPSRAFIKRVIALPNDAIEIRRGEVFVNGQKLNEPYITNPGTYSLELQTVPEDQYFVLGDNRNNSFDSHEWGPVKEEEIIGQAMFVYWPFGNIGVAGNHSINLGFVKLPVPFL